MNLHGIFFTLGLLGLHTHLFASGLIFKDSCLKGSQTTVSAVGDILIHSPLQKQALDNRTNERFRSLWNHVEPLLRKADLRYGNLEGPAARSFALSNKPMIFNFHHTVVEDLKTSGFDVISTANNHSLDRGNKGIDETIEAFEAQSLNFTGTFHSQKNTPLTTITNKNGFNIAWIACTDLSNAGKSKQIQFCDDPNLLEEITQKSRNPRIDAVFVTPHWGAEKAHNPSHRQRSLAQRFFEAGALVVIGAHPHVLQPWEKVHIDGKDRLVFYSLGNFVSNQLYWGIPQMTSVIAYIGLTKKANQTIINGAKVTPIRMTRHPSFTALSIGTLKEHKQARAHALSFFGGESSEILPHEKLITNPECD